MVQLYPTMVPALIHNTQLDQRKVQDDVLAECAKNVLQKISTQLYYSLQKLFLAVFT